MTDPQWQRAAEIFASAIELPENQRQAFVEEQCGSDEALRAEVEDLLRHHVAAPTDFVTPPESVGGTGPIIVGRRLGDFELLAELGRGGMGVVYKARQLSLRREVAVKILVSGFATGPGEIERFHREARAAARLDHPHIAKVLVDGVAQVDGDQKIHWFAMELVAGHSLQHELQQQRIERSDGLLLPAFGTGGYVTATARFVAETALALAHAHSQKLVHRDIKPGNLLVGRTDDGTPYAKVVDFGIARDQSLGSLTRSDQLLGSVYYMSPEQARQIEAQVDHRTDVYSLGVVLYEMLTLVRPFRGKTRDEVITKIKNVEPQAITARNRQVPRDLATVCNKAMSKVPEHRYASAQELADDLQRFLNHQAVSAQPPTLLHRARWFVRRNTVALMTAAVAVLCLLVGGYLAARWSAAERLQQQVDEVMLLDADRDWSDNDIHELVTVRSRLRVLQEQAGVTKFAPSLQRLEQRFEELRKTWRQAGRRQLQTGLERTREGSFGHRQVVDGVRLLKNLAVLFPEESSHASADVFAPRLSVAVRDQNGGAVAAMVSYRVLDPVTGQPGDPVVVGDAPLRNVPVVMGHLRVQVEAAGWGVREFARVCLPATKTEVKVRLAAHQRQRPGMVRVEGDTLRLRAPAAGIVSPLRRRRVTVSTFWIDECEVSNADFRAFLAANPDRSPPFYWSSIRAGSAQDQLPVAAISWQSARAYAEWRGKRLPTHAEWMLAAGGATGRRVPWPGDEAKFRGNTFKQRPPVGARPPKVAHYLACAAPVRSHPEARTPSGIYHMLGNVWEFVESHFAERSGSTFLPDYQRCWALGPGWEASTESRYLDTIRHLGVGENYPQINIGFRCASSTPPKQ